MEIWLQKAIDFFPEFAKYYVNLDDTNEVYVKDESELWIDLEDWFYLAVKEEIFHYKKES